MSIEKNFIVIPAFCEAIVIQETIKEIQTVGYENIIVVDDGSNDSTHTLAKASGATVLRHMLNRGKGAAVKTGIEAAKILGAEIVITMDGDGQHNPADIASMLKYIQEGYDVVLGTRLKNPQNMPKFKIFANYFGNFCTWIIYGLWVTDSQSGFRAYSKRALEMIDTKTDRYEYDSEVIREISRHKLKMIEIPIEVRYTRYSMGKKNKQSLKNGLKTLIKMILSA